MYIYIITGPVIMGTRGAGYMYFRELQQKTRLWSSIVTLPFLDLNPRIVVPQTHISSSEWDRTDCLLTVGRSVVVVTSLNHILSTLTKDSSFRQFITVAPGGNIRCCFLWLVGNTYICVYDKNLILGLLAVFYRYRCEWLRAGRKYHSIFHI